MYYSAYLQEEIMGTGFTIAPGCVHTGAGLGSPGGRCSFNEFLQHIWSPSKVGEYQEVEADRPTITLFTEQLQRTFHSVNIAEFERGFNRFRRAGLPRGITYNIDGGRLFPGASDYYDAMKKCGAVVQNFRTFFDGMPGDHPEKERGLKLLDRAKVASGWIVDQRAKEMDEYRMGTRTDGSSLRVGRIDGIDWKIKPGRDVSRRVGAYQVWDSVATIAANPSREADIRRAFLAWIRDPLNDKRFV